MMVEPGMDVLLTKVDSKYTLVSVSSKRARKIMAKDDGGLENPVTIALNEIAEGKVEWVREEEKEEIEEPEVNEVAPEEEPDA